MKKKQRIFVAAIFTAMGIVSLLSLKGQSAEMTAPMHGIPIHQFAEAR